MWKGIPPLDTLLFVVSLLGYLLGYNLHLFDQISISFIVLMMGSL